jgi:hypothetical protein
LPAHGPARYLTRVGRVVGAGPGALGGSTTARLARQSPGGRRLAVQLRILAGGGPAPRSDNPNLAVAEF